MALALTSKSLRAAAHEAAAGAKGAVPLVVASGTALAMDSLLTTMTPGFGKTAVRFGIVGGGLYVGLAMKGMVAQVGLGAAAGSLWNFFRK